MAGSGRGQQQGAETPAFAELLGHGSDAVTLLLALVGDAVDLGDAGGHYGGGGTQ